MLPVNLRFLPPIPEGWRIFTADEDVAGIPYRIYDAIKFAEGKHQRLEFELEPNNPVDRNAIKIFGIYKQWFFFTHRLHIGYVPAEIAKMVHESREFPSILPRLKNIWMGGRHQIVVYVRFDIMVPKLPKAKK